MTGPKVFSKAAHSVYERELDKEVRAGVIPNHIAIIMDGNRRYAKEILDADVTEGHGKGEERLEEILEWCQELGIRYITVYAFSTENFSRPDREVQYLMDLCTASFYKVADLPKTHEKGMRVRVMGDRTKLPTELNEAIDYAEQKTNGYSNFIFTIALAYGRQEITEAARSIARKVKAGEIDPEDISIDMLSQNMYIPDIPDPDLVLRTSGEIRLSNFLLWQMAYSELYFTDVYWPEFRYIDLLRAIRTYQQRVRRYGE